MHYALTYERLLCLLSEIGFAPDALEPWPTWKIFKRFLREPVEGASSDALVQIGLYGDREGRRIHLYFVRQFSDERAHDVPERDEQFAHLICELIFRAESAPIKELREIWSQDCASLAAFVDRLEGDPTFQALMNARPLASEVYWEEC